MTSGTGAGYAGFGTRRLESGSDAGGPTIVLLHGIFDSADTWTGVLSGLAERGHRAVAVDLPGYGRADRRAPGPALPQLDSFVADLVAAEAGMQPVILVGNSLGAALAVRAALRADLPICGVVSIDVAGLGYRPWIEASIGRYSLPPEVLSRLPLPRQVTQGRAAARLIARGLYARTSAADPTVVARFAALAGDNRELALVAAEGRAVLRELAARLPAGEVPPMLILHGRRDFLVPPSASMRLHRSYPDSELRILAHCGHCPQLDEPTLVADMISCFARQA